MKDFQIETRKAKLKDGEEVPHGPAGVELRTDYTLCVSDQNSALEELHLMVFNILSQKSLK